MSDTTVTVIQLLFIPIIALMAFISGILPSKIPWCKNSLNILGIANAFSGGVFLAIALLHIIPEAAESYNDYLHPDEEVTSEYVSFSDNKLKHGDGDHDFPLPYALVFCGYAFILLIDRVVFDTHSLVDNHEHGHVHDAVQENFVQNVKSSFIKFQKMLSDDRNGRPNGENSTRINESQLINDGIKQYLSHNDKFAVRMSVALRRKNYNKLVSKSHIAVHKGLDDEQAHLFADQNNIDLRDSVAHPHDHKDKDHKHGHHHDHDHDHDHDHVEVDSLNPPKSRLCTCNLTPIVLMIALSTHAIFEGIAVGIIEKQQDLWTFVIAISMHKWAEAMCLGISMSKNFKDEIRTVYILVLIFSLATPFGIGIGMCIKGSSPLIDIIFSSLAGGTFTYIACSEVIVEEFAVPTFKWVKMIMFLLGA